MTHLNTIESVQKVLIIDDNETAAKVLGRLLTYKGYRVELAHIGSEGVRAAARFEPDISLIDIGLPDMSGYEVARALRERNTTSLLIALSGFGQESDKVKAKDAGFDGHLTKPVSFAQLEQAFAMERTSFLGSSV